MEIAIIDDNQILREKIKEILSSNNYHDVIDTYACIKEYHQSNKLYNLLLLDIELPGENGIVYVNQNLKKDIRIIYITSHTELMINAFHENVIGFIPKEQLSNLLIENVEKTRQNIEKEKKYEFKTLSGNFMIEKNKIVYFCYQDTIVYMKIIQGELIRLTAKYLSNIKLGLPDTFYQVNREYVVNLKKIKSVDVKAHCITLEDGKCVTVSRRLWTEFKGRYNMARYSND